jgi:general secretion pathway protein C
VAPQRGGIGNGLDCEHDNRRMWARLSSLVMWTLVSASALYWGLQVFTTAPAAPPHTQTVPTAQGLHGGLTRLMGADVPVPVAAAATPPAADARYALVGVLSPHPAAAAREGLALIAVDGKPAKAYRVGARVDQDNVLQKVGPRSAALGPAGSAAAVSLQIAAPQTLSPAAAPRPVAPPRPMETAAPHLATPSQDSKIDAAARQ